MKRIHPAAIAAILTLAAACEKEPARKTDYPQFGVPPMKEDAALYTFGENASPYRSLEFTESGLYVLGCVPGTRAGDGPGEEWFLAGSCSVSGGEARLEGFGKASVDGNRVTITRSGEEGVTLEAAVRKASGASDKTGALCRTWKPATTSVSVTATGHETVWLNFDGFDLREVAARAGQAGITFPYPASALDGYAMTGVTFTANGTAVATFSDADPFVGSWQWKDEKEGTIDYDLRLNRPGVLPGKGTVQVTFDKDELLIYNESAAAGFDTVSLMTLTEKK